MYMAYMTAKPGQYGSWARSAMQWRHIVNGHLEVRFFLSILSINILTNSTVPLALGADARAAVSTMVHANGALRDEESMVMELDPDGHLESMDWVDEDDEGLSAAGGEIDDAVRAAYNHIMPSVILYDPILLY